MIKTILLNPVLNSIAPNDMTINQTMDIRVTNECIEATLYTNYNDKKTSDHKSFYFSDFEKNTIYNVKYATDGFYPYLPNDNYYTERDYERGAFNFYLSEDGKNVEVECFMKTNVKNRENINIRYSMCEDPESTFRFSNYIKNKYPEYKNFFSLDDDSLGEILNPNKTLSYMDAQVDIITKLLMEILEKEKDNLSPESKVLYENFKDKFEKTSLLNIMSQDKLMNKLRHKETTRKFQTQRKELVGEKIDE